ncbi:MULTISPECIES: flavin reductase [unclassified Enterococcus]|uniref:flavin reductase n=1 Tax=unclassified Enterococcus TaxID=2608891 RepID=UPI001555B9A4|nr:MULTISPECIES: flavin reductase [unclassified Enterococcus]MBS7576574.1 flavin reductase [Enterococcus sp. MMGLQ5-2]MBS7583939.1 flavin reductase [Enterococcus sp. MMGLQ5-1]NPD11800.1 flavin reductase family protein [Enterococcus sp. MMGLQ5-1]NPD36411.1 flavin reductase family protein [Enterococcus sp. MMGLQ5-2]
MTLKKVKIDQLNFNPFTKIGKEWFLITAGDSIKNCNTMTASWGTMGVLWHKNIVTVYIRPQRYTKEFINQFTHFSLSFFDASHRKDLNYLGKVSGREKPDKITEANLQPIEIEQTISFKEANYIFIVKKLYHDQLEPDSFLFDDLTTKYYPEHDFHEVFVAEIEAVYTQE